MVTLSPYIIVVATLVLAVTHSSIVADYVPTAMSLLDNLSTLTLASVDNVTSSMSAIRQEVTATTNANVESTTCVFNATINDTSCSPVTTVPTQLPHSVLLTVVLGLLAGLVSLVTILGNITVLLAFGLERTIRQPTNYFLASLAVSDLLIGTFSMPLYTQYLLWGAWPLGPWLCDLWLSLDWTVCLTSQYTVFLITMDRFLSVKIPARYRNWRTEHKVLIMITITWIVPTLIFFTSIIGWQYFIGTRSVGEHECEVQFMNDAMFIFLLTIGYFWITLFVIGILYGGIYKVALDLQRKSDAKHKKLQTTMELAQDGQTPVGGSATDIRDDGCASGGSNNNSNGNDGNRNGGQNSRLSKKALQSRKSVRAALPCPAGAQINTTSFTTKANRDDDRSSSPAFASDDENSSSGGAAAPPSKPSPILSSGVYIGRPNPSAGIVNSALFANTGGLVRSLHGDLFFGPVDCQDNKTAQNSSTPSSAKPADTSADKLLSPLSKSKSTDADESVQSPDETTTVYSPPPTDQYEKQTTPLLTDRNEINRGCRFIDEKSFMETLSSENSALLPVISLMNSEADESDDQTGDGASSPIWKRRASLPSINNDDYDFDDELSDFVTGDFTTNTTTLNSSFFNRTAEDDDDDDENDDGTANETTPALASRSSEAGAAEQSGDGKATGNSIPGSGDAVANHQSSSPSGLGKAVGSAAISDTNEDSSRSDIHCLSAATRRRRNKDTRLHTLVKSVRSRNSRKRNRRERKSKSENRARKALRTISIILGAFVLCWMPYHIAVMVMALCKDCVPPSVYAFTYWMCYLNSPINPFCYAFANAQFKRTFIRIMRFDWHRT